jgi:hypothetical protein
MFELAVENNELNKLGNTGGSCRTLKSRVTRCRTVAVCGSVLLKYAKSCVRGIEELLKEAEDGSKPS